MNEAAVGQRVVELVEMVAATAVPGKGKAAAEGTYVPSSPRGSGAIEDGLDQLRLHVKYLLFDLEATRRENRYLRQMLETRPKRDFDDRGDGGSGAP